MKEKVYCVLLCVLTLAFTACATTKNEEPKTTAAYPITIMDSFGENITIQEEPATIISGAPNVTEIIYALNAENKLVARTDYCDYPKEALEIASIGSIQAPDIEKIIELNPDLIIISAHFNKENMKILNKMGITVLSLYEDENFEGSFALIEKIGAALNRETKATELIENMKTVINEVTALATGLEKPDVYYVIDFGEYGDYTAGGNTFVGQMIAMAGGNNIASNVEGWGFNLENLLEADPDIIIVSNRHDAKTSFENAPGYKELTAVKEGRVYEINNDLLDRQGIRNAEGLKALFEIFSINSQNLES